MLGLRVKSTEANRAGGRKQSRCDPRGRHRLCSFNAKQEAPGPAQTGSLPRATRYLQLLAQTEAFDQAAVTREVLALVVVQQLAALADHLEQTTAGVVILGVGLEMIGQAVDAGGQQCDLNFGRTSVALGALEVSNDLCLLFVSNSYISLLRLSFSKPAIVMEVVRQTQAIHAYGDTASCAGASRTMRCPMAIRLPLRGSNPAARK